MRKDNEPVVIYIACSDTTEAFIERLNQVTGFKCTTRSDAMFVWNFPQNMFRVRLLDDGSIVVSKTTDSMGFRVYSASEEEILACCLINCDDALAEYLKEF